MEKIKEFSTSRNQPVFWISISTTQHSFCWPLPSLAEYLILTWAKRLKNVTWDYNNQSLLLITSAPKSPVNFPRYFTAPHILPRQVRDIWGYTLFSPQYLNFQEPNLVWKPIPWIAGSCFGISELEEKPSFSLAQMSHRTQNNAVIISEEQILSGKIF